jgi:hypothetical protein
MKQAKSIDLRTKKDRRSDDHFQKMHFGFGRDILEVTLEASPLDKGKGSIPIINPRLKSKSQTKQRSRELNPKYVDAMVIFLPLKRSSRWRKHSLTH